jgi:hypothetical protein
VVLYEDVYDNQPVYMLYHALRDLVHVAPTQPSPTLISAEAVDDMDGSAHDPDGSTDLDAPGALSSFFHLFSLSCFLTI